MSHPKVYKVVKPVTAIRVFFAVALLASALIEYAASSVLSTPFEQVSVSATAGAAALILAKLAHLV
jgi:hypothetical protein